MSTMFDKNLAPEFESVKDDRAFNVGSIRFFSGRTREDDGATTKLYDKWEAIPDPYGIFKKVKQVSVDIKTDYNYPNALRPEINPG